MNERKSRFGDRSALPDDPALRVLQMRPRGVASEPTAPVTYPGRLAAEDQEGLVGRLQKAREEAQGTRAELEAERAARTRDRDEGLLLLKVDPETIGLTDFANRSDLSLSTIDETFKAFKESIRRNGQDTPVRVRPAADGALMLYELVEGHRRLAAIRELNREVEGGFKILIRVDAKASELVDLCLKMYRENADRQDLSAHETGSMFALWLKAGVFKKQREIAEFTGLKENTVSQYLTIAGLPTEVLEAFGDVRQISMRWNAARASACKEHRTETLARAKKIAKQTPRPDAETVYRLLTAHVPTTRASRRSSKKSDMVYVDDKVLFKIALKDTHLTFSRWQVPPDMVPALYDDVKSFFDQWLKAHARPKA
jgi:ParB family transcriptional regulator, chromosome partitioning protein